MQKHIILFLFIVTYLFTGCNNTGNKFSIDGQISNMPEQTVYLSELAVDNTMLIDSVKSDKTGGFKLQGSAPEPGLYRLNFSGDKYKQIILSVDKGNVTVTSDWNNFEQYAIKGSASSESLLTLLKQVRSSMQNFNTLAVILDTFKARQNDSMVDVVMTDINEQNYQLTQFIEHYADTSKYLPNVVFAAQILNPKNEKEYYKALIANINKRFPNAKMGKDFIAKINAIYGNAQTVQEPQAISVGVNAPEIVLPGIDGKEITLSSFKGKYVLLDFWASWCGPCRRENPNVVAAYNKFKDKNFTIFGVSLDDDKDKWTEAIAKDGLTWTHASDLMGWESVAARTYMVNQIPTNFLIDPNGVVIARDLREEDLHNKLAEFLK